MTDRKTEMQVACAIAVLGNISTPTLEAVARQLGILAPTYPGSEDAGRPYNSDRAQLAALGGQGSGEGKARTSGQHSEPQA